MMKHDENKCSPWNSGTCSEQYERGWKNWDVRLAFRPKCVTFISEQIKHTFFIKGYQSLIYTSAYLRT